MYRQTVGIPCAYIWWSAITPKLPMSVALTLSQVLRDSMFSGSQVIGS